MYTRARQAAQSRAPATTTSNDLVGLNADWAPVVLFHGICRLRPINTSLKILSNSIGSDRLEARPLSPIFNHVAFGVERRVESCIYISTLVVCECFFRRYGLQNTCPTTGCLVSPCHRFLHLCPMSLVLWTMTLDVWCKVLILGSCRLSNWPTSNLRFTNTLSLSFLTPT